jgi:alkylglycerol monooxygenase
LSTGAFEESFQLMVESFGLKLNILLYTWVHTRCRLVKYDAKKWPLLTFCGLMLGVDLGYYLCHRINHEFHVFWAAHSVHHSGEDYNMATALRQSVPQRLTSPLYYLPLALVFNPVAFSAHQQLNTIYQFWVHTELVGWLGPLEYLLQTPAAHRMHHRVPGNCNYGGVFIIWDRIFGTYLCENEVGYWDNYGLAKSAATFSPLELHLSHWRKVALMPGSWLRRLCARRPVDTRWVCKPSKVFEALPAPSERTLKQSRTRYEGARELSPREELLLVAAATVAGAKFLSLALHHERKSRKALLLGAASVAGTLSGVGRCMSEGTRGGGAVPVCMGLVAAAASSLA